VRFWRPSTGSTFHLSTRRWIKAALDASAFGSSLPLDVAFRVCACAVQDWVAEDVLSHAGRPTDDWAISKVLMENPFLMIADDSDDKALKYALRKSFRALRPPSHRKEWETARLSLSLDDIYFGDSKSSVGIQLADICAHVMLRRFRDGIQDEFFRIVDPHAVCAKAEPYWTQCQHVLRSHESGPTTGLLPLSGVSADVPALPEASAPTGPFGDQK
jgi:hypothetical protein